MKCFLKKLTLSNFKGVRSFSTEFEHVTNILGDNATGKTSLKDAFLWLFFGKDSTDRKDFEIKTLDPNNKPYHNLDHEVEAIILVDDQEITIRRTLREKWVKKRGEKEAVFSGHETAFFWNDVPMKEGEYQAKIASVFNENIFKLITNTDYFNSLKWQDRRSVLLGMAGNISDTEVLDSIITVSNKYDYDALITALNQKKSVDEFKREIQVKKKKLKDELQLLPARIDEANRSLPDPVDYDGISRQLLMLESDIANVDAMLSNKTVEQKQHQDEVAKLLQERDGYHREKMQIEFDENNKARNLAMQREQVIADKKRVLVSRRDEKSRLTNEYMNEERRMKSLEQQKSELAQKWESINNEQLVFNDNEFSCPACKRAYETTDIEAKKNELVANFNKDKARRLQDITTRGYQLADDIKVITSSLENIKAKGLTLAAELDILQKDIAILEEEHTRLTADESRSQMDALASNNRILELLDIIERLDEQINTPFQGADNSALLARKRDLTYEIDGLKKQLAGKEQRERTLARIEELKGQEGAMAQELVTLEGAEFSVERFIKAKMDMLESRINGRFQIVRFKMFEEQINGGQVEACTTLINGVPYSDANTAAKIQAGLDIINTLSRHYDTYGPVWVDNRESVVRLPETSSQLINLIVSEEHKQLTVESQAVAEWA